MSLSPSVPSQRTSLLLDKPVNRKVHQKRLCHDKNKATQSKRIKILRHFNNLQQVSPANPSPANLSDQCLAANHFLESPTYSSPPGAAVTTTTTAFLPAMKQQSKIVQVVVQSSKDRDNICRDESYFGHSYVSVRFACPEVITELSNRVCEPTSLYATTVKRGLEKFEYNTTSDDSRLLSRASMYATPEPPHCSLESISDMYRLASKLIRRNHVLPTKFNYDIMYTRRSNFEFLIMSEPILMLCSSTRPDNSNIVTDDFFVNHVIWCIVSGLQQGNFFNTADEIKVPYVSIDIVCSKCVLTLSPDSKSLSRSDTTTSSDDDTVAAHEEEPPPTDAKIYSLDLMRPLSLDVQRKRLSFIKELSIKLHC